MLYEATFTVPSVSYKPERKIPLLKNYRLLFRTSCTPNTQLPEPIQIEKLINRNLKKPIKAFLKPDADGRYFLVETPDLPVYGYSESPEEAINMFRREIECLYEELQAEEQFTEDWAKVRRFLEDVIEEGR